MNNYLKIIPTYQQPNRKRREDFDKLCEIIGANPGIRTGEIAALFYPAKIVLAARHRSGLVGMLLDLECAKKVTYKDDRYYAVEVES